MKFENYINESYIYLPNEINEINNFISNNCQPYLNLIKGKNPLYRGISGVGEYGIKSVRQDRKPKGYLTITDFKRFNKWLQKNGHNRRDNTILCTPDKDWAEGFGMNLYIIFPIGNFSYSWMNAKDFNKDDKKTGWKYNSVEKFLIHNRGINLNFSFEQYFHTDTGFNFAYKQKYEFWIKCKEYYYVLDDDSIVWDQKYQEIV